jgi:maltose alpha-D-glucosyltransferase/alpha-amylase
LRDVAGMLRSFAYAGATIGGASAEAWEREARDAFRGGYLERGEAAFLPNDRDNVDCLISLFEMEKAFYELAYELNNRPDWVRVPLQGILQLLEASR